jgi:hypothetical protein
MSAGLEQFGRPYKGLALERFLLLFHFRDDIILQVAQRVPRIVAAFAPELRNSRQQLVSAWLDAEFADTVPNSSRGYMNDVALASRVGVEIAIAPAARAHVLTPSNSCPIRALKRESNLNQSEEICSIA